MQPDAFDYGYPRENASHSPYQPSAPVNAPGLTHIPTAHATPEPAHPRSQNMRGQSRTRRVHIPLTYRPNDVPMFVVRAILPVELLPRRIQMP